MSFFQTLLIASFVGTMIWIVQMLIRPITEKLFSQTWHYYTSLIPVFFLLGGSVLVFRTVQFMLSLLPGRDYLVAHNTNFTSEVMRTTYIQLPQGETAHESIFQNWYHNVVQTENITEIALIVVLVWAIGAVIYVAQQMISYRVFKHAILQNCRIYDVPQCPVQVIKSSKANTPLLMGLWEPIIVLPDTEIGEKELDLIISHELIHFKRSDLVVKLVTLLAAAVHWFNPAVYLLSKQINALCELSCDEKLVQKMDTESRKFYGQTLLAMLEYSVTQRNIICTSNLCNSKKAMKRRLINVMKVKQVKKSTLLLALLVTMVMIGCGGLVAYAAGSAATEYETEEAAMITIQYADGTVNVYTYEELLQQYRLLQANGLPIPDEYPAALNRYASENPPRFDFSTGGGRNIYVQSPDGSVLYYDDEGNESFAPREKRTPWPPVDEETQKKIDERMEQLDWYMQNIVDTYTLMGVPVPQEDLDAMDEIIHEIYQLYGITPFGVQ